MDLATCPECGGLVERFDNEFPPHTRPDSKMRCRGSWQPDWLIELRPHLADVAAEVSEGLGGRHVKVWVDEDWHQPVCAIDYRKDETNTIFLLLRMAMATYINEPGVPDQMRLQNFGPEGPGSTI